MSRKSTQVLLHPVRIMKMQLIFQLAAIASRITQSATQPSYVVNIIAVALVLYLMVVTWLLLTRGMGPIEKTRRRRR